MRLAFTGRESAKGRASAAARRRASRAAMRSGSCGRLLLLALAALALATSASASAAQARAKGFRVTRVCHRARPGRAACLALKLVPASLGTAQLQASARRQSSEAAHGARPAVAIKTPFPGFLTSQRLHDAYALPSETGSSQVQTIAIVDAFDDPTAEADLGVYDEQFGLPLCTSANGCFHKVNQAGNASPLPRKEGEWAGEISIDVQMAHAICNSCKILLVEASSEEFGDLGAAVNTAAAAGATEISNSYGGPEQHSYVALASSRYNHPGVVLAASSGDCGYLNEACEEEEVAADFPADSPDVLAVGGTSLSESAGSWSSTAWIEGGSGCSKDFTAALWQSTAANFAATGCGSGRSVADVAAIGDPETGVDVYDSTPEGNGDPTGWGVWGGTSVAAPIVAAEYALAGGTHGVEYPAATLYPHLGQAAALYDVDSGSNGSCGAATECNAAVGYDGPTGVGSPTGLAAFTAEGAPASTAPPSITGFAEQGQTLSLAPGAWSNAPSSTGEQWARCNAAGYACAPIAGATGPSYKLTAADLGARIRVQESAANGAGEGAQAASAPSAAVASDVPAISGFTPAEGITGSALRIEGNALAGVSEVELGKLAASFTVISPTSIEAVVPNGAKAGKLTISAPGGTAKTKSKFTPTFSLLSFGPKHGALGKTVKLKGIGFTPSASVAFDGTPASDVNFVSATRLEAVVPPGAGSGPITVTNTASPAGTVSSAGVFQIP